MWIIMSIIFYECVCHQMVKIPAISREKCLWLGSISTSSQQPTVNSCGSERLICHQWTRFADYLHIQTRTRKRTNTAKKSNVCTNTNAKNVGVWHERTEPYCRIVRAQDMRIKQFYSPISCSACVFSSHSYRAAIFSHSHCGVAHFSHRVCCRCRTVAD